MKLTNKITKLAGALLISSLFFSCQNFDRPEMIIIPDPEPAPYSPLKIYIPFTGNSVADSSMYKFKTAGTGIIYVPGITGIGMKGGTGNYLLIDKPDDLTDMPNPIDSIKNMDAYTISMWMNLKTSEVNGGARELFCIPHTGKGWGYLDIFTDGSNASGVLFKIHMFNNRTGALVDAWIDNCRLADALDKWVHLVFRYNGETSQFDVYLNGEQAYTKALGDYGKLVFEDMSPTLVLANFPKNTVPPLTTDTENWGWAIPFNGELDQFRFYNIALNDEDIEDLYFNKQ